jgi:hypothetical protein
MKIRYVLCVLLCNFVHSALFSVESETKNVIAAFQNSGSIASMPSVQSITGLDAFYNLCPTTPIKEQLGSATPVDCPTSPIAKEQVVRAITPVVDCPTSPVAKTGDQFSAITANHANSNLNNRHNRHGMLGFICKKPSKYRG